MGNTASSQPCAHCGNKASDQQLYCEGCLGPSYCGKKCQSSHWKAVHKKECHQIAAKGLETVLNRLGGLEGIRYIVEDIDDKGGDPEVTADLEKVAVWSWTLMSTNPHGLKIVHISALTAVIIYKKLDELRGKAVDMSRWGKMLDRAFTDLPWPRLPRELDDLIIYMEAINQLVNAGMAVEAAKHYERYYPAVEKHHRRGYDLKANYLVEWAHLLVVVAEHAVQQGDQGPEVCHQLIKDAKDMAVRAANALKGVDIHPEARPSKVETLVRCSTRLTKMNAPDVALVFINMALDLSCREERAENMLWLAQTLVALRRLDEAWATALEGLRMTSREDLVQLANAHCMLMKIAFEREDYEAALHHARSAWDLAMARDAKGRFDPLTADEDDVDRCLGLSGAGMGDALEELGRFDEAIEADKRYVTHRRLRNRKPLGPTTRAGMVAAMVNRLGEAADCYRTAIDLNSDNDFWDYYIYSLKMNRKPLDLLVEVLEQQGTPEAMEELSRRRAQRDERMEQEEELRQQSLKETREMAQEYVAQHEMQREKMLSKKKGKGKGKKKGGGGGKKKGKGKKKKGGKGRKGKGHHPSTPLGFPPSSTKEVAEEEINDEEEEEAAVEEEQGQKDVAVASEPQEYKREEEDEDDEEEEECAICFVTIVKGDGEEGYDDQVGVLGCGHCFHNDCLDLWASKCMEKKVACTCPYCRAPLARKK